VREWAGLTATGLRCSDDDDDDETRSDQQEEVVVFHPIIQPALLPLVLA